MFRLFILLLCRYEQSFEIFDIINLMDALEMVFEVLTRTVILKKIHSGWKQTLALINVIGVMCFYQYD